MTKWLIVLAWWFTFTLTDSTGAVVQEGERGPYESEQACLQRRDQFLVRLERPRIDARDPKKVKVLPKLNAEVLPCDPDRLEKMPR